MIRETHLDWIDIMEPARVARGLELVVQETRYPMKSVLLEPGTQDEARKAYQQQASGYCKTEDQHLTDDPRHRPVVSQVMPVSPRMNLMSPASAARQERLK